MIYIIRHGQTELNSRGVLQGRSNHALNEKGIAQAKEAAKMLRDIPFSVVWSSPLVRALQTAEIIAPGLTPAVDERLIEMDYGPYEGADLHNLPQEVITFFRDFVHNPAPRGMEPLEAVVRRAGAFMEEHCRSEENILISTHAIAMKGALEYLTPDANGAYWSKHIKNCAVYTAEQTKTGYTVPIELKI